MMRFKMAGVFFLMMVLAFAGGLYARNLALQPAATAVSLTLIDLTEAHEIRTAASQSDTYIFDFDFAAGPDGWSTGDEQEDLVSLDEGILQSRLSQSAWLVSSPLDINGAQVTNIKLRIRTDAPTQAQLSWAEDDSFDPARSISFDIPVQDRWQVINLDLSNNPDWRETRVKQLRLGIATADDQVIFEIDYIRGVDSGVIIIPSCQCKTPAR